MIIHQINKSNSTKDRIILLLSHQWPLTAKELYSQIKRTSPSKISYQAVHKMLSELINQKIILKEERKYSLVPSWISSQKDFFTNLDKHYNQKITFNENLPSKIVFNTYYEMYSFVADFLSKDNLETKGKPICFLDHYWWNLLILTSDQIKKIGAFSKKYQFYCVAKGGGPLDTMLMNYYKDYGMEVINNPNIQTEHGTVVIGDLFIQIFYPKKLCAIMHELAGKQTTIDNVNIKKAQEELVYQKNEIILLIHKDASLAEIKRKEIIGYFS